MSEPLCDTSDVSTQLLRPLTDEAEVIAVEQLIAAASALLRTAAPSIDTRVARYRLNPQDLTAISPETVAVVVAGVVKRYMRNPEGIASESAGPFSVTYALRSEKDARGVLQITESDLRVLFPNRKRMRAGTIRTRAALAPRPVGRYGPVSGVEQAISTVVDWSAQLPVDAENVAIAPLLGPDAGA